MNKLYEYFKESIKKLDKRGLLIKSIRSIENKMYVLMYKMCTLLPIFTSKVIMLSYQTGITPNFEPLYNELKLNHTQVKINYIGGHKRGIFQLFKLAFELATAQTIILDNYYSYIYPLKIRESTKVIQIWHATGIFKKFGILALDGIDSRTEEFEKRAHRNYTHVIVSSDYVKGPYAKAFGISEEKMYALGVPRTDIFFDKDYKKKVQEEIYSRFPEFKEKKVILYAPTFRGNLEERKRFRNRLEFKLLNELKSEGYIVIYKLHPAVQEPLQIPKDMEGFIYDMTKYEDINKLFIVSDVLVTDYSSSIFEFALLGKPIILYAYDLKEYLLERGFYEDYEAFVPGPICHTTREVIDSVLNLIDGGIDYDNFMCKYLGACDGNSTKRVVESIILSNK